MKLTVMNCASQKTSGIHPVEILTEQEGEDRSLLNWILSSSNNDKQKHFSLRAVQQTAEIQL